MPEILFILLFAAGVLWFVVGIGKRKRRRILRRIAYELGASYSHAGVFTEDRVNIVRGQQKMSLMLYSRSFFGSAARASFVGRWPGQRLGIASDEQHMPHFVNPQSITTRQMSKELAGLVVQLNNCPNFANTHVSTSQEVFSCQADTDNLNAYALLRWTQIATQLYLDALAESEIGIEFDATQERTISMEAMCQVCGTIPEGKQRVLCSRCGAPHHEDCWNYNGGCAIYGCRCSELLDPLRVR